MVADREIDLRGMGCSTVLIHLAAAARDCVATTYVTVITDDKGAPEELPAWCRMTGHRYSGPMVGSHDRYQLIFHP
jgi:tRNA 2-thiouridine synthesizing protein A